MLSGVCPLLSARPPHQVKRVSYPEYVLPEVIEHPGYAVNKALSRRC